jgi:hypothetical protein
MPYARGMSTNTTRPRRTTIASLPVTCPRCDGTGKWNNLDRYPCRECNATGRVQVRLEVVATSSHAYAEWRQLSAKTGRPLKGKCGVPAILAADVPSWRTGATVGGGAYAFAEAPRRAGRTVSILGVCPDGELHVDYRDGGYSATGPHTIPAAAPEAPGTYRVDVTVADGEHDLALREAVALVRELNAGLPQFPR